MRRLASMAAECVELVNLDMAAVQWRTVRRCAARRYWCQMLQREKKKILPHKTCSNGKTPRLPPSHSLKQSDDFFKLFVRANVAVLPGRKIAHSN